VGGGVDVGGRDRAVGRQGLAEGVAEAPGHGVADDGLVDEDVGDTARPVGVEHGEPGGERPPGQAGGEEPEGDDDGGGDAAHWPRYRRTPPPA
jgi:hypothetical protein